MSDQHYSDDELKARGIPSFLESRPLSILHPSLRPRPQKGRNLLELFDEDMDSEETELLQVYLRLKPSKEVNDLYEVRSDKCFITSMDTTTMGHGRRTQQNVSKMYTFSQIFGPESTQKEIFEAVVKDNLKKLPEGQSCTLLTYGASGSGKTYTLMGTVGSPGLVPRSLEYVFKLIDASQKPIYKPSEGSGKVLGYAEQEAELHWVKRLRQTSVPLRDNYRRMSTHLNSCMSSINLANRKRHYVWVSFVEIYNEAIYDLLAPPEKRAKLRIREDSSGNVYVEGANQAFVRSGEEAYDVMVAGKHNLVVASTGIHAHSSRSHCIFTITMLTETERGIGSSCMRLCDLAGCERARATRNTGARMAESRAINSSLHVLERCLHALHRLQRQRQRQAQRLDTVLPYRESKLTRLLGRGFSGAEGEAVSMVVTVNPALRYASETKHVLSLAAIAQDIQLSSTLQTSTVGSSSTTQADISADTTVELMRLRAENERLQFELAHAHTRIRDLMVSAEEYRQKMSKTINEAIKETQDIDRCYYEGEIKSLKDEIKDMAEEYETRLAESAEPAPSNNTVQNHLQNKVTELMNTVADLEEKLTAATLARSQAETEVEYLRKCIEEKDELNYRYNRAGYQDDVVTVSDSERESDDETDDPLQESLEPIFKIVNLNKTQQKMNNLNIQESIDEDNGDDSGKTCDNVLPEDEDVDGLSEDDNTKDSYRQSSSENIETVNTEMKDQSPDAKYTENCIKKEEQFDVDNCDQQDRQCQENALNESSVVDVEKLKKLNLHRGSYILATNTELPDDSFDVKVKENLETGAGDFSMDGVKINDVTPALNLSDDDIKTKVNENFESMTETLNANNDELKFDNIKSNTEVPKDSAAVKVNDKSFGNKFSAAYDDKMTINKKEPTTSKSKTETTVNKIIEAFRTKLGKDNSLNQFEQLEIATKHCTDDVCKEKDGDLVEIKKFKGRKNYFGDPVNCNQNKITYNIKLFNEICKPLENVITNQDPDKFAKIKRIYFDNSDASKDFEPNARLFEDATAKSYKESFINKNANVLNDNVTNDSLDVFEERESLSILTPPTNIEQGQHANIITKAEAKLNTTISIIETNDSANKYTAPGCSNTGSAILNGSRSDKEIFDDTIEAFDDIYKTTSARVTEFDRLFTNETAATVKTDNHADIQLKPIEQQDIHSDNGTLRYGLRNRAIPKTEKKSLRLRRKGQNEDKVSSDKEETKFKDIGNLQQEFSDITINVPVVKKDVSDMSSPEKVTEEDENVPPEVGFRSCPAKSVTRSRRKLFTPQVEPLDESLGHTGDSNERIRVPRPSYRRGKARRKL